MTTPSAPGLEFAAHVSVDLSEPQEFGNVPTGVRRIIPIIGGTIEGPLLSAEILTGGADWQIVTPDGTAIIDTRYSAATPSGAQLFLSTQGVRHGSPEVLARLAAGENVPTDEYYFRLTIRLESGAPELAWVNQTVFIASAERQASTVHYDLFAVR